MKLASFGRGSAVWILAGLSAALLWWRYEYGRGAVPAVVVAARHQLGVVEPARIQALYVRPGDAVRAGQALAQLDCSDTTAELEVERARMQEVLAQVESLAVQLAGETRERRLQMESDLAQLRASATSAKGLQEAQKAELQMLDEQLRRLAHAAGNRLAEIDRLSALRARQERLLSRTRYGPELVQLWSEVSDQVRSVLVAMENDNLDVRLAPVRASVETQSRVIQRLVEERNRCMIVSPVDGHVSEVLHAAGDAVASGAIVVTVVDARASEVVAWVAEGGMHSLNQGLPVWVEPRERSVARPARGVIESVGPEIAEMPLRLWAVPNRPQYARPLRIRVEPGADLFPGELAMVRVEQGAAYANADSLPSSFPAEVPESLRRMTRLEASDLTWLPGRDRLLVVSDDTGFPGADEHPAWVFTADADGRFDAEPLRISGVEKVSDLEALTRAPDGTVYLLASQSASRKGRRPTKRQWLLRAVLNEQRLEVTGKLALYDRLLAPLPFDQRAELGISERLDIEGMAWHEGGLLLGLKAPQDAAGRARIWYLESIDSVLDGTAAAADARLSLFASLALPTCATAAPGGVAGLFLEGDRLYLTSTLPDGPSCGSAWSIDLPIGDNAPVKLADWPELKPEGITRVGSADLLVAFDAGAEVPRFARLVGR